MFQEKEIEAYRRIKAPVTLKSRILLSVEAQRKRALKQRTAWVGAAACLALMLFAGRLLGPNETIVSVRGVAVSYGDIVLDDSFAYSVAMMSRGRSSMPKIQVPLEIHVTESAHVRISQGTLQNESNTDPESNHVTEMQLSESGVIYWNVNGILSDPPTCTITSDGKEYHYVIGFEEEDGVFTIKQKRRLLQ